MMRVSLTQSKGPPVYQIAKQELHTVQDWIRFAVSAMERSGAYYGHGTDNPLDEAVALVFGALDLPLNTPPALWGARVMVDEIELLADWIQQRCEEKVPLPYLTGLAWFAGLEFKVDPHVLIPRSPVAELIEHSFEPWIQYDQVDRVLDLCAGSGCIGIACAYAFPDASVDLVELSPEAAHISRENVEAHGLRDHVDVIESDLFDQIGDRKYDIIISNPPYVDAIDMAELPAEYHHEPRMALAAGEDGLDVAHRIITGAADHLTPHGLLIVEVGNSKSALIEAYPELPFVWLDFERGGDGVFLLTAQQLEDWREPSVAE